MSDEEYLLVTQAEITEIRNQIGRLDEYLAAMYSRRGRISATIRLAEIQAEEVEKVKTIFIKAQNDAELQARGRKIIVESNQWAKENLTATQTPET